MRDVFGLSKAGEVGGQQQQGGGQTLGAAAGGGGNIAVTDLAWSPPYGGLHRATTSERDPSQAGTGSGGKDDEKTPDADGGASLYGGGENAIRRIPLTHSG